MVCHGGVGPWSILSVYLLKFFPLAVDVFPMRNAVYDNLICDSESGDKRRYRSQVNSQSFENHC